MKFDLHLHTTASDGTDTPEALVTLAAREGFSLIAVTDHDTVSGVAPAVEAGEKLGVRVIAGVEISAGGASENETHLLGYGVRDLDRLDAALSEMRAQREERMEKMVARLNELGVGITLGEATQSAEGTVGRAHLARALVARGDVRDIRDAFNRYLSPGRPAYVPRVKLTLEEAVRLLRSVGALPVIAHPGQRKSDLNWLDARVRALKPVGLAGLEAFHPSHASDTAQLIEHVARKNGLLVTGGSDYHGAIKQVTIGEGLGAWSARNDDLALFVKKMEEYLEFWGN